MTVFTNWNGTLIKKDEISISPENRSFRYGDGCFETMKLINHKLLLDRYHFERLFESMEKLGLDFPSNFSGNLLLQQIYDLAEINGQSSFARIRLNVYRQNFVSGKLSSKADYIIESIHGDVDTNCFNKKGLAVDIYTKAQKSCDSFSVIKSNNYQPYTMAKLWAENNELDDAIVCNCFGRIADSSFANIFIIEDGIIKTPSLTEGCVNGVMRRHLLQCLRKNDYPFSEEPLSVRQIKNASEVFLTNAVIGLRWVAKMGVNEYTNTMSSILYQKFIGPLFMK